MSALGKATSFAYSTEKQSALGAAGADALGAGPLLDEAAVRSIADTPSEIKRKGAEVSWSPTSSLGHAS